MLRNATSDLLAFADFPIHRTRIRSANPLEPLNKEVNRGTHVVGLFLNSEALLRPAGAVLI